MLGSRRRNKKGDISTALAFQGIIVYLRALQGHSRRNLIEGSVSESPGKTRYESQIPLSSWTEQHLRTGRLVKDAYSSRYSEWNADEGWSSQEWKSDEVMEVRTVRLVNEQPPGLFTQHTTVLLLMTMIWTLTPSRTDHLHVDVQRHVMVI